MHGGFVLDGVGVVSALSIGNRLGGLIVSISAGGALAFDTVNLLINTFSSLVRLSSKKKMDLIS